MRTIGNLLAGPLIANTKRYVRRSLGLKPKHGRRWKRKINRAGWTYWTAACRELDCGLIISMDIHGYTLKTIADGVFTEVRTTYTVWGAKRFAEHFVKEATRRR